MLDKFNELPDWISRGLDDLFPYDNSENSDQSFLKRLEPVSYTHLRAHET